ncbi:uncharacterized protein LOC125049395 isoform X1 [Pieris napi]|uniref:uncharacterized protein LOC125049395 isoform X1 n=1 Tax=Pieris napi TaxID=78633 RepID=UPI001FB8F3D8|nr:uncharacterized protein LOC125049395 isoform X1 [Pieris napi]
MQLLHQHSPNVFLRDLNMNSVDIRSACSHIEVKEKKSSNASLLLMNPVASGDNMAVDLVQKKEELPPIVPCCEGRELQINEEIVRSGLSAISVKHDSVIHCMSMSCACERMQSPPGLVKHRNSFRCLHRPDLKRVPYLRRLAPDDLETLFRGYAEFHLRATPKSNRKDRDSVRSLAPAANVFKDMRDKDDGTALRPIPETRSGAEDVPAGMRLHGARARLYTSVLAGGTAGDQAEAACTSEYYDTTVAEDTLPEDEIQLNEELQIILPPRCDDITAESSITTSER